MHSAFNRKVGDNYLQLLTLENCFKVQVFVEFLLETVPQMIVQVTINNSTMWDGAAKFSFAMSVLIFVRDATLITLFIARKFIDQSSDPLIRPQAEGKNMSRVELEASTNISNYLLD